MKRVLTSLFSKRPVYIGVHTSMIYYMLMFCAPDVNGKAQHPVYKYLKSAGQEFRGDIEWNFSASTSLKSLFCIHSLRLAYFLVNRRGDVVKRYAAGTDLQSSDVVDVIRALVRERAQRDL